MSPSAKPPKASASDAERPKASASDAESPKAAAKAAEPSRPERLAFIIDPATGEVDLIEAVGAGGVRRKLGPEDRAGLAPERAGRSLEAIVEQAFLAGMDYVLGDGDVDEDESAPSQAEHELLRPLIRHSAARRLMQPGVLRRAALEDLFQSAISSREASEAAADPGRGSGAGGQS